MSRQPKLDRAISPGNAVKLHQLRSFTEVFGFAAFTDGGGTTGTKALTNKIPKGAHFYGAIVKVPTGFANDSTATVQLGDGSDVDRYSTGTPSVFAASPNGIVIGVPSGAIHHQAEKTVTITITGGSDFTSINAGQIIVTMMYFGGPPDG